ncbi:MAG: hypothetical protein QXE18_02070 [Thermoplasmata archaeon]
MQIRDSQEIDRSMENDRASTGKKLIALTIVIAMVISAIAMLLPSMLPKEGVPSGDTLPAEAAANNGEPEWTYIVSDMFHMYLNDYDYNRSGGITFDELGRHQSVDGMPWWFILRDPNYGEKIYRYTYPHIFFYNPYSTATTPIENVGYAAWAPYRLRVEARNITDCRTNSGDESTNTVIYVPDLDATPGVMNGGWMNLTYYLTYMTTNEMRAARSGTTYGVHYARWFFGVPINQVPVASADDGYWCQLMLRANYSRQAAMSYLGWDGVTNVQDWFNTNLADIEANWFDIWMAEGSGGGWADIYTAYDYPEDIRVLKLKLDAINSTTDFTDGKDLVIYMWSLSWGMDAQIVRYMEKANLLKTIFQNWMEDMYLNISISPSMSNTTLRGTANYHLGLWEDDDPSVWMSGWAIEAQHMDWCGNTATHNSYPSPYNPYDPDQYPSENRYRLSRIPWTTHFGGYVSYWVAPLEHDMAQWEKIIIQAPSTDVICFYPGKSVSDNLDDVRTNLMNNQYWGTMVLSKGGNYPQAVIESAYNPATKTITLVGPIDFPTQTWSWGGLQFGIPCIMFDVSPVSYYEITNDLSDDNKYTPGVSFNLYVTAKNGTGVTVTSWNGSVDLAANPSAGVTFGSTHLTFDGSTGVVTTTVTISGSDAVNITATDSWFPAEISGYAIYVMIPEFSTLIIPVMGAMAIFLVIRAKKRREEEG